MAELLSVTVDRTSVKVLFAPAAENGSKAETGVTSNKVASGVPFEGKTKICKLDSLFLVILKKVCCKNDGLHERSDVVSAVTADILVLCSGQTATSF